MKKFVRQVTKLELKKTVKVNIEIWMRENLENSYRYKIKRDQFRIFTSHMYTTKDLRNLNNHIPH